MKKTVFMLPLLFALLFAQNTLEKFDEGMKYLLGEGVKQNRQKALELLTQAADEGSPEAQYNLAIMYYNGDGVDQNITKAVNLLEASAKANYKYAVANIGRIYMQTYDFTKALEWLKRNAASGDSEANYLIAEIFVMQGKYKEAKPYAQKAMREGIEAAKLLWQEYKLANY